MMFAYMPRPSRTAATMVAKSLVCEDHLGGALGDVGAGDPHGDADVGLFQRGRC